MFTYKKAPYKIFALGPKFCWAGPKSYISAMHEFGLHVFSAKR